MCKKVFLTLIIFLYLTNNLYPSTLRLTDKSTVSLLTCSPNDDAIYALFGHSALRIKDDSTNIDVVFDYGIFDFSSSNFIYRFVKGETDYMVKGRNFKHFLFEYQYREMGVTEQVLNLSQTERQQVFDALVINAMPENSIYRYNFFYDNCSTRPRDMVQNNIEGKVDYTVFSKELTYRDLINQCLILTPWSKFGINIVIGSGADKIVSERQKDFLPAYLLVAFNNASIVDKLGNSRKLVSSSTELLLASNGALELQNAKLEGRNATNIPLYVGLILLLVALLLSYIQYKSKNASCIVGLFDSLLFLVSGLAGCIIFFLMFFSEHPCVDANWNLVWLNPLPLFFIPFFFVKSRTKYVISYHFVNFVALTLFLVGFLLIPQTLEIAFIPYILTLWTRSGVNILVRNNQ